LNNVERIFDDLLEAQDEKESYISKFKESEDKINGLIHRVFIQNEDGKKLLEYWVNEFVLSPSIQPQFTQFEAGLTEGGKNFVRRILLAIHKAEHREDKPSIFKFMRGLIK